MPHRRQLRRLGHASCLCPALLRRPERSDRSYPTPPEENIMGKYFLAWLLGVPTVVLVIGYFVFGG